MRIYFSQKIIFSKVFPSESLFLSRSFYDSAAYASGMVCQKSISLLSRCAHYWRKKTVSFILCLVICVFKFIWRSVLKIVSAKNFTKGEIVRFLVVYILWKRIFRKMLSKMSWHVGTTSQRTYCKLWRFISVRDMLKIQLENISAWLVLQEAKFLEAPGSRFACVRFLNMAWRHFRKHLVWRKIFYWRLSWIIAPTCCSSLKNPIRVFCLYIGACFTLWCTEAVISKTESFRVSCLC